MEPARQRPKPPVLDSHRAEPVRGPCPLIAPDPRWPPLPHLVPAADHAEDVTLPLTPDEQLWRGRLLELALILKGEVDVPSLTSSLARALTFYPPAAGRFVLLPVDNGIRGVHGNEISLLCNNAGASFSASATTERAPYFAGPLHERFFDSAVGTEPDPKKFKRKDEPIVGGPLMCARVTQFSDATVLAVSFVFGLTDVVGMGLFLQTWARLHRGETPGETPTMGRAELDGQTFHCENPPLGGFEFAALHRTGPTAAQGGAGMRQPSRFNGEVVACRVFLPEDLEELLAEVTERMRKRRIIYTTDTISAADLAFSMTVEALGGSVAASMLVDYRAALDIPHHFGVASALVDLELDQGSDVAGWIKMQTKTCLGPKSRNFWVWKLTRNRCSVEPDLIVSSWVEGLPLDKLSFAVVEDSVRVMSGSSFWREEQKRGCFAIMLPHASGGIEVQAMLPRASLSKLMGTAAAHGPKMQNAWSLWNPQEDTRG